MSTSHDETPGSVPQGSGDPQLDAALARSRTIGRDGSLDANASVTQLDGAFDRQDTGHVVEPSFDAPVADAAPAPQAPVVEEQAPDPEPLEQPAPEQPAEDTAPVPSPVVEDAARGDAAGEPSTPDAAAVAPAADEGPRAATRSGALRSARRGQLQQLHVRQLSRPRGGAPVDAESAAGELAAPTLPSGVNSTPGPSAPAPAAAQAAPEAEAEAEAAIPATIEVDRTGSSREREAASAEAEVLAPLGLDDTLLEERPPRSNRVFAFWFALLGGIVFAGLFLAAFAALRAVLTEHRDLLANALAFAPTAAFWLPAIIVAVLLILWAVISNRAGSWSYIAGSLVAAAVAYTAYHVGVALQLTLNTGGLTIVDPFATITDPAHLPAGLLAGLIASQVFTWFGGIIASRGRALRREHAGRSRRQEP